MNFQLDDLSMHYKVIGEGMPVLMLHGRPTDHAASMGAFEPVFRERTGWQRIYVDLPGMGLTTGGSWINGNDDVVDVLL
ncbi:MAG: alpha/beta hydrolase, partial [Anaerolineales bacterium]|nr:alpha/beta hydrolase [Anaerolineales bacterium]